MIEEKEMFVVGIREHHLFGYIAIPLIVGNCNEEFCKIIRSVVFQDIIDEPDGYTEIQKKIVTVIDNFSDDKIYAFFNKNKKLSITDFFSSLDDDYITKRIRPYIEKHIKHLLELLKKNTINLYYKPYRYEHIYKSDKISIDSTPGKAIFNFERTEEGIKYYLTVLFGEKEISIFKKKPIILLNKPALIELEHILMIIEEIDAKKLRPFYDKQFVQVPKEMEMKYFQNFILKTVRDHNVKTKGFEIIEPNVEKQAELYIETDWLGELAFIPKFIYGNKIFNFFDKMPNFVELDKKTFNITKYSRDKKWEDKYIKLLSSFSDLEIHENRFKVKTSNKIKEFQVQTSINWLNENNETLDNWGFKIKQQFAQKKYFVKNVSLDFKIENKIDWFDISAIVKFGEYEISFYKLKENILNDIHEIVLPNNEIAIIPNVWFQKYKNILKFAKKTSKSHLKLKKIHFFALLDIEFSEAKELNISQLEEFFKNPTAHTIGLPKTLKTTLRNYQEIGYSWLNQLRTNNFGGCLADDMGLGKTVQILSGVLKSLEEDPNKFDKKTSEKQKSTNLNIVIVPRSLLHNWYNEVKKNTPKINAVIYAGNERSKLIDKIETADLIITSYGIARNDLDIFLEINFNYIILDESQYIKNHTSKTYQAIKLLNGKNKIVLTGTPIENSLRDLWTQLNFVNPGLLGSYKFFRENYITPIEKTSNEKTKIELKRIIAPFILRRTKEEVGKDLPEIEEQTILCEMTEEQEKLYEQEKSKIRNKIIEFYNNGTLKKSSFYILQALTKLRQIACHPSMIDENSSSGKFDEVCDRLQEITNKGHKVLIFSSFVKHLKVFENKFIKQKIPFEILTGETSNRQKIINKFEKTDKIKIFLISIKAGGVGLNLTSADYVFILDPWWNPAIERQAIARSHRIGQTKNVFALKFITFGTVEEKIQKLQEKKLQLANEFIDANNYFNYFEDETIVKLFD
ncbi:MAG: DEAD/DEAH box helicase [Bacteroidales bacterium]|nr:DEAD/DEAH box helicase [Bacteroidales bacterium]